MPDLKLDTTRPCVVLVGAWNPAIFSPQWVGRNLFEIPEGQTFDIKVLQRSDDIRQVTYVGEIGYFITNNRIELYINGYNEENFQSVSDVISNLVSTLPHTPFGNFGINFRFVAVDPVDEVFDLLKSNDQIEVNYILQSQEFNAHIQFENETQLNWRRTPTDDKIIFDFNYDHQYAGPKTFEKLNKDRFIKLLSESCTAIKRLYNLAGYEEVVHPLDQIEATEGGTSGQV